PMTGWANAPPAAATTASTPNCLILRIICSSGSAAPGAAVVSVVDQPTQRRGRLPAETLGQLQLATGRGLVALVVPRDRQPRVRVPELGIDREHALQLPRPAVDVADR